MPSIIEETVLAQASSHEPTRKRRRDDYHDTGCHAKLLRQAPYEQVTQHTHVHDENHNPSVQRILLPIPMTRKSMGPSYSASNGNDAKRPRITPVHSYHGPMSGSNTILTHTPSDAGSPRCISSISQFDSHAPLLGEDVEVRHDDTRPTHKPSKSTTGEVGHERQTANLDTSPCHVCHRKPSSKTEIGLFMTCEGCKRRACWLCRRKCVGWGEDEGNITTAETVLEEDRMSHDEDVEGPPAAKLLPDLPDGFSVVEELEATDGSHRIRHRDTVCSACCVERGPEGDIWCLGCVRLHEP